MHFEIKNKKDSYEYLKALFTEEYKLTKHLANECVAKIDSFLVNIRPDIFIGIEYPYVDKLYRASYYSYYGSKLNPYNRNCIRLSFFATQFTISDFFNTESKKKIQDAFLGFLVIRPTPPNVIGRNILRPDIFLKKQKTLSMTTHGHAAINGLKLEIEGFPHSSQDTEMMVCAETTIWSIMEYFSHRYSDYKPVLPNDIHKILSSTSMERQIPSDGLTGLQISFALKELGFGVKMYSLDGYSLNEIFKLIKIYVESGIPVVTTIGNLTVGHVMNIIGRTDFDYSNIFTFPVAATIKGGTVLHDYYEQPCRYLVIDDNLAPYDTITLNDPASNYGTDPIWIGCNIHGAIIPLYHRIYMDAKKAYKLAFEWLAELSAIITLPSLVVRTLLTSSRSYKDYIALNAGLSVIAKNEIISIDMPKFLWLVELSTPDLIPTQEACGMILIDATEPKKGNVLATFINDIYLKKINGSLIPYTVPLPPFTIFHNLKLF